MRVIVFIDGQNLYHGAKDAWSPPLAGASRYYWPCYDVEKLAEALVPRESDRTLAQVRIYTGVPSILVNEHWHHFWNNKLRYLSNRGVVVYRGRINRSGQEKGVDVSLAIDLIRLTYEEQYDGAIIVSQDWDFGPAIRLAGEISRAQGNNPFFESAFCVGPGTHSTRGIPGTTWVEIDQTMYDSCFDPREYRKL